MTGDRAGDDVSESVPAWWKTVAAKLAFMVIDNEHPAMTQADKEQGAATLLAHAIKTESAAPSLRRAALSDPPPSREQATDTPTDLRPEGAP